MSKQTPTDDDFLITDPDQQPGVVVDVEPGVRPVMLMDGYMSEKMVRCSFCKQRQRHRKGCFALLPDGSKALCGHCCAVEFTDKETVARIEREVDRKVDRARQRTISAAVLEGVPELIDVLDRDFVQLEQRVHSVMEALEQAFPSMRQRKRPKLAVARDNLGSILETAEARLTERRIEEILQKRQRIDEAIREGLVLLRQGIESISVECIASRLPDLAAKAGFDKARMKGRTIIASKQSNWLGEDDAWKWQFELPEFAMPDTGEIESLLGSPKSAPG